MAIIELSDGRRIPLVKPNLWDGAAVEKEMGWNRKAYQQNMQSVSMQTAFSIFASLRRAGLDVTFTQCAELDGIENVRAQPGDLARAGVDEEGEGEEGPDPQSSATPGDAETDET